VQSKEDIRRRQHQKAIIGEVSPQVADERAGVVDMFDDFARDRHVEAMAQINGGRIAAHDVVAAAVQLAHALFDYVNTSDMSRGPAQVLMKPSVVAFAFGAVRDTPHIQDLFAGYELRNESLNRAGRTHRANHRRFSAERNADRAFAEQSDARPVMNEFTVTAAPRPAAGESSATFWRLGRLGRSGGCAYAALHGTMAMSLHPLQRIHGLDSRIGRQTSYPDNRR
jgi:hypothetical protein